MTGWTGKMLRVDLTAGATSVEELCPHDLRDFVGARGLGSRLLYDAGAYAVDPLAPENPLIFATGPLTGTYAPSGGRYNVLCRSPLTGAIAASNSGGYWGPELKFAGFDLIYVTGKATSPVYLWVSDGRAEIRPADGIWGRTVSETEDAVRAQTHPEAKVACIGPAGERLVRIACVVNDKSRAAGRSGVGAVMGSKNLKAIAVRGTRPVRVADKEGFKAARKRAMEKILSHPVTSGGLPTYGTAVLVNVINAHGAFPTRNFQTGVFAEAERISGETLAKEYLVRKKACFACSMACGRPTLIPSGPFKGSGEGPEYEAAWALGADCGVSDLAAVTAANWQCNEMGMDPISYGATLACAMELYQRGYLTREQAGREMRWGDGQLLVEGVRLTALREGVGNLLAEGSYRLAGEFGHPELSMTAKKQEYPAYEPRAVQGIGLNYATSNRGGCHVRGYTISPEVLGVPEKLDPLVPDNKAFWVKAFQDATALVDSSGVCLFVTFAIGAPEIADLLAAATGEAYTTESGLLAGERIWNLERMFNLKAGFTRADDTLAPRLLSEPMPEGPARGQVSRLEVMLPEYYRLRGWDEEGRPTEETLARLGLKW
ncbi:MAG: aldehyde ferredoxin oxidoreductase family protein [Bacillota bacterium]|nr:aldehyde ferredoxin oxidoreductase family protein [Bacillota bacterium]